MATTTPVYQRCPICSKELRPVERVEAVIVPAGVPEYLSRVKRRPYERHVKWTLVRCEREHTFKSVGCGALYGERSYP